MKADDLLDAIGIIDDRFIEDAMTRHRQPTKWIKYGSVAACFICVVALGIFLLKQSPASELQGNSIEQGNIEANSTTSCSMVLAQDSVFLSDTEQGTFLLNSETGELEQISDFGGSLIYTTEGTFCWNLSTGAVYQVTESSVSYTGEIPPNSQLIGVAAGICYWMPSNEITYNWGIYQTSVSSSETELLVSLPDVVQAACLVGQSIYYQTGTGVIYAYDLDQGTSTLISNEFEEQHGEASSDTERYYTSGKCTFFDDFMVVIVETYKRDTSGGYTFDSWGCYQISYETGDSTLLTSTQANTNFSLCNQKLYYIADGTFTLASYDLNTGITETLGMNDIFIVTTEILVREQMCYCVVPSGSGVEIYCYDILSGTSEMVFDFTQEGLDGNHE